MTMCGATQPVSGSEEPLVCNLPTGHPADVHGVQIMSGITPFVRWGDAVRWTAEDEQILHARHTTRTPQVRTTRHPR